jgi:hypothetical protein
MSRHGSYEEAHAPNTHSPRPPPCPTSPGLERGPARHHESQQRRTPLSTTRPDISEAHQARASSPLRSSRSSLTDPRRTQCSPAITGLRLRIRRPTGATVPAAYSAVDIPASLSRALCRIPANMVQTISIAILTVEVIGRGLLFERSPAGPIKVLWTTRLLWTNEQRPRLPCGMGRVSQRATTGHPEVGDLQHNWVGKGVRWGQRNSEANPLTQPGRGPRALDVPGVLKRSSLGSCRSSRGRREMQNAHRDH